MQFKGQEKGEGVSKIQFNWFNLLSVDNKQGKGCSLKIFNLTYIFASKVNVYSLALFISH